MEKTDCKYGDKDIINVRSLPDFLSAMKKVKAGRVGYRMIAEKQVWKAFSGEETFVQRPEWITYVNSWGKSILDQRIAYAQDLRLESALSA